MDLKQIAKDSAKTLISYLTYRAVRVVVAQLSETNPPLAMWLNGFSTTGKIQDGELYLQELMQAEQGLALRVMTVRAHLAQEITEFLPEMIRTGIDQANADHRRQYLERMTQISAIEPSTDAIDPPSE
ncbi:MAG: RbcX chaperonin protein [Microcoleus sp. SIO2G3]|nr:RbcX chaperonin protein [Microcoleus sp. SIO2G3]